MGKEGKKEETKDEKGYFFMNILNGLGLIINSMTPNSLKK
jgi:hypothetical protein